MRFEERKSRHLILLTCSKFSTGDVIDEDPAVEELEFLPVISFDGEMNGIFWTPQDSKDDDWEPPFVADRDFIAFDPQCIEVGVHTFLHETVFEDLSFTFGWREIFECALPRLLELLKGQFDDANHAPVSVLTVWEYRTFYESYAEGTEHDLEWNYLGVADNWPSFVGEKEQQQVKSNG